MSNNQRVSKARWAIYLKLKGHIFQVNGLFFQMNGHFLQAEGQFIKQRGTFSKQNSIFSREETIRGWVQDGRLSRARSVFPVYANSTPAKD